MNYFSTANACHEPHTFCHTTLSDLPQEARQYLFEIGEPHGLLLPPVDRVAFHQHRLIHALFRDLVAIHNAKIVRRWYARKVPPQRCTNGRKQGLRKGTHVVNDPGSYMLAVARHLLLQVLHDFRVRFDALMWVELQGYVLNTRERRGIRDRLLWTVLDAAQNELDSVKEVAGCGKSLLTSSYKRNWFAHAMSELQRWRVYYKMTIYVQ